MKLYKIRDWDRLFENNRSREIKSLTFVLFPNRHDGENFSAIMAHKNGAEIFSAWCLILQVASKCDPRGTLLRGGKKPHDSVSLALKTRAPEKWFKLALEFLESETDWFVVENVTDQPELIPHPPAAIPHPPAVPMFCSVLLDSVPSGGCKGETVTVGNGEKRDDVFEKSRAILFWLNEKAGRHHRETPENLEIIERRLKEVKGDVDGVKLMIERQCSLWKGTPQSEYLRISTLFRPSNFSEYYDARDLPVIRTGGNGKPQLTANHANGF